MPPTHPAVPKTDVLLGAWRTMLALLFALERLLKAFCASCCVCSCSWSVFLRFGTLQGRFWRVFGPSGDGFGGPGDLYFNGLVRACGCVAQKRWIRKNHNFSQVFLGFLHITRNAPTSKNDAKSFQKPFAQRFPKRSR